MEPELTENKASDNALTTIADRVWDVVVIGAGPAGALSALLAARSGASTLLVERKRFPRPKVCGGCLNASGLALLESLGLGHIALKYGLPIHQLRLGLKGRQTELSLPGGVSIARTELDAELARLAQDAGALFVQETRASVGAVDDSSREVTLARHDREVRVKGRAVVLAAGLSGSQIPGEPAFSTRVKRRSRIGAGCFLKHFPSEYNQGTIAMAIGRSGYVGMTPTLVGLDVAAAFDADFLKSQGGPAKASAAILLEAGFPALPSMLDAEWLGTLPLTRTTRPLASSRVFLVGDAAGYVEPFTGQGMAIALQGALALSPYLREAIDRWTPAIGEAWSRDYLRNVAARHWPAALIAAIVRRPALASLTFGLAGAFPALPGSLVRAVNRPVYTHSS